VAGGGSGAPAGGCVSWSSGGGGAGGFRESKCACVQQYQDVGQLLL
jgi:hypothetical protein